VFDMDDFANSSSCGEFGNSTPSASHQNALGGRFPFPFKPQGRLRTNRVSTLFLSPKALNRKGASKGQQNT